MRPLFALKMPWVDWQASLTKYNASAVLYYTSTRPALAVWSACWTARAKAGISMKVSPISAARRDSAVYCSRFEAMP